MSQIEITGGKGFHLAFANGWRISVQIGPGNYCDNKDRDYLWYQKDIHSLPPSKDAEIAIFRPDGSWFQFPDGQDIAAYVPAEEVFDWIEKVRNF